MSDPVVVHPEVAAALQAGGPVVALESTLLAHGLPRERAGAVAQRLEATVRSGGATPATIAVLGGRVHVGLGEDGLAQLLAADVPKLGVRDLPVALARGIDGATTVASTAVLAARAGIRVFATGGLGGVHRDYAAVQDESADLGVLGSTRIVLVSAGVKSILDVAATVERLETLGVLVLGYRTDVFPLFYAAAGGPALDWRVESAEEVAAIVAARDALDVSPGAVLVANPLAPGQGLEPAEHDRVLRGALEAAAAAGVTGKAITPFLLEHVEEATGGRSVDVNVELVVSNAALAAGIAAALP